MTAKRTPIHKQSGDPLERLDTPVSRTRALVHHVPGLAARHRAVRGPGGNISRVFGS